MLDQLLAAFHAACPLLLERNCMVARIFARLQQAEPTDRDEALDKALQSLRVDEDGHLEGVFGRVFAEARLANLVARMAMDGRIISEPANADFKYLQVLGVVRREQDHLVFRNELYAEFARSSPQLVRNDTTSAPTTALLVPPQDAYAFMEIDELREIALSAEQGAVRAHNAGSYRLALVGFGCALESVLMDWLLTLNASDLARAISQTRNVRFNRHENRTNPESWRLINLIKVGSSVTGSVGIVEPPDALREWRNLVPPALARNPYRPENVLEPESRAASGLLSALRRDLSTLMSTR